MSGNKQLKNVFSVVFLLLFHMEMENVTMLLQTSMQTLTEICIYCALLGCSIKMFLFLHFPSRYCASLKFQHCKKCSIPLLANKRLLEEFFFGIMLVSPLHGKLEKRKSRWPSTKLRDFEFTAPLWKSCHHIVWREQSLSRTHPRCPLLPVGAWSSECCNVVTVHGTTFPVMSSCDYPVLFLNQINKAN